MRSHPPVLEVRGLGVLREGVCILRDLNWRVERGQHWVVLGANGSGKTSLLAALTGYLTPTTGDIELLGERFGETDWRELRTRIGLVSSAVRQLMAESEPTLDTVASGRYAMIDFWGRPSRQDRAAARRLLAAVRCSALSERPWAVLSQGERQRILIARALMARPKVLILDEPCAGLDPVAREHFLEFLHHLARQRGGPALVLVTHHVEEIVPAFTHGLLLQDGQVLGAGALAEQLTSRRLSDLFRAEVRLSRSAQRWQLEVRPQRRGVM